MVERGTGPTGSLWSGAHRALVTAVSDTPSVIGLRGILPFQLALALGHCVGTGRSPSEAKSAVWRHAVAKYGELRNKHCSPFMATSLTFWQLFAIIDVL